MFIECNDIMLEALASYYEAINEGPEGFSPVEVKIDRIIGWRLGVSL